MTATLIKPLESLSVSPQLPVDNFCLKYLRASKLLCVEDQSSSSISNQPSHVSVSMRLKLPTRLSANEIQWQLLVTWQRDSEQLTANGFADFSEDQKNVLLNRRLWLKYHIQMNSKFEAQLLKLIREESQQIYDEFATECTLQLNTVPNTKEEVSSYWLQMFSKSHLNSNQASGSNITQPQLQMSTEASPLLINQYEIANMYHALVHSHLMPVLLSREQVLSERLRKIQPKRPFTSSSLHPGELVRRKFAIFVRKLYKQLEPSSSPDESFSSTDNEEEVNENITTTTTTNDVLNPMTTGQGSSSFYSLARSLSSAAPKSVSAGLDRLDQVESSSRLEESYTIQLGAQLKSTHNLRIIRCDMRSEFSAPKFTGCQKYTGVVEFEPQTIQASMSLYTNKLCAVLLLVPDDHLTTMRGSMRRSKSNSQMNQANGATRDISYHAGEVHFESSDVQRRHAKEILAEQVATHDAKVKMNVGDFYTSKHSNMSEAHLIFHLCAFQSTGGEDAPATEDEDEYDMLSNDSAEFHCLRQSDMSSRHAVILGLRNIIKACICYDVHTITLPLLLTHEMTEEMTINWVMKRAELVLKCIKGFMIEFVQWGGPQPVGESRNLQFVVPQGLMDETFYSLSNLIPTIFRESRTVNLT